MQPIRVLLVDDSSEFLASSRSFLSADARIEIVGEARNGWDAVRLASELRPDLVLMDLVMPEMSGIAATHCIKAAADAPTVVIVSMVEESEVRERFGWGVVDGFVDKSQFANSISLLVDSICTRKVTQ